MRGYYRRQEQAQAIGLTAGGALLEKLRSKPLTDAALLCNF
jgi:hypothetical protein